jgi:hypothetical protein
MLFLYFDEFVFFSPYVVAFFPPSKLSFLLLDVLIAVLSGIVMAVSFFQARNTKLRTGFGSRGSKVGVAGIVIAIFSGACPCYYLVPLLAFAGGAGGVLATLGILINSYEMPIKVASLFLLVVVAFRLERSLRGSCSLG